MAHLEVLQRHRRYRLLVQINRHTKAEILASQSEPWVDGGWRVWSGETRESEVGTSAVARAASARDAVLLSLCWLQNLAARVQQWRFHGDERFFFLVREVGCTSIPCCHVHMFRRQRIHSRISVRTCTYCHGALQRLVNCETRNIILCLSQKTCTWYMCSYM